VTELESSKGKLLSKEEKAAKVRVAIKQLQDLQNEWQKASQDVVSQKKANLMKQLADKEAELAKDQKMLKVINLEKKLAEKKLALEKLVEMKNAGAKESVQKEEEKEAAKRQEMVTNVLNMARTLQAAQGKNASVPHAAAKVVDGKPAMLKTVLDNLEGRMKDVSGKMAKLDAAEKKHDDQLKSATFLKAPVNGTTDAIDKGRSLLNMLMKKEHRQFAKSRATLKSEYKELSDAVGSIKKGDVAGLTKVMNHMQGEMQSLQAKSHKFLY
jgi:hypothetical protein